MESAIPSFFLTALKEKPQNLQKRPPLEGDLNGIIGFENAVPASWTDQVTGTTTTLADSDGDGIVDDYQVAVASKSLEMSLAGIQPSLRATFGSAAIQTIKQFLDRHVGLWPPRDDLLSLIPSAHATTLNIATETDEISTPICERSGVTCCNITMATLSFECYHTVITNTDPMYVYLTDNTYVSDSLMMNPDTETRWFANAPSDLAAGSDGLYALTKGMALKVSSDGFVVIGDPLTDYFDFSVSDDQFDVDTGNNLFGILNDTAGVELLDSTGAYVDASTQTEASYYTVIKYVNGKMYYGIEDKGPDYSGKIYFALDNTVVDPDGATSNNIYFIKANNLNDVDANGAYLTFKKTISFDSQNITANGRMYPYSLVVYEDEAGQARLRMAKNKGSRDDTVERFGGGTPIGSYSDYEGLQDIQIYYAASAGKAALLDSKQNKVWVVDFNATSRTVTLDASKGVSVGDHPQAMALSADKKKLYVVNHDDDTLSVLSLYDDAGTIRDIPVVSDTVDLKTYVAGKTMTLYPNTLVLKDSSLVIGCEGLKGSLVIDASTL